MVLAGRQIANDALPHLLKYLVLGHREQLFMALRQRLLLPSPHRLEAAELFEVVRPVFRGQRAYIFCDRCLAAFDCALLRGPPRRIDLADFLDALTRCQLLICLLVHFRLNWLYTARWPVLDDVPC